MNKYLIPTPVYEAIPFIYAVCGILLFLDTGLVSPKLVGVLMFLAGILIIKMRISYRYFKEPYHDQ